MGIKTRLFGGFSIHVNDVEISGLNSRHQVLLAYLAIQHPKPVPRSELAFTLWADSNEEQALTNLRKALHHIRQKLNNDEVVQIDSRTLHLNPKTQIDLADFITALDSAKHAHGTNDAEAEQTMLETAAAFYRGNLLPNIYDEWLIPERDRLRDMFIRGMDRLIALLEARKHYRDAIKYAQRLLQTDNLREETYRTLIRLHALNNDRAAALNVYHKNPINFISAEDVAKFIVLALEDPRVRNQTLTIGGPQNLTFEEVVAIYERLSCKKARRKYVPASRIQLMSSLYKPFNETQSRFMAMRHEIATSNWRVDMSDMLMHYPVRLMCLEELVKRGVG